MAAAAAATTATTAAAAAADVTGLGSRENGKQEWAVGDYR
jgi:hypothetical protein